MIRLGIRRTILPKPVSMPGKDFSSGSTTRFTPARAEFSMPSFSHDAVFLIAFQASDPAPTADEAVFLIQPKMPPSANDCTGNVPPLLYRSEVSVGVFGLPPSIGARAALMPC